MVVKKNATILRNLVDWMRMQNTTPGTGGPDRRIPAPTLVIDDEADHASINTRDPEQDPTTINRLIRELLNSFDRVSLVGYTATPFANIFIPSTSRRPTWRDTARISFPVPLSSTSSRPPITSGPIRVRASRG